MMTAGEIYQVARAAGFPPSTAVSMVAIALKESGGNPYAYNGVPPDDSYGLWQINMLGNLGAARRVQFGLSANQQLFDPHVNARAALAIWGGNDANLGRHWYIDRGINRDRYFQYLPAAQAAAAAVDGAVPPVLYVDDGVLSAGGEVDWRVVGGVSLAAFGLWWAISD